MAQYVYAGPAYRGGRKVGTWALRCGGIDFFGRENQPS